MMQQIKNNLYRSISALITDVDISMFEADSTYAAKAAAMPQSPAAQVEKPKEESTSLSSNFKQFTDAEIEQLLNERTRMNENTNDANGELMNEGVD